MVLSFFGAGGLPGCILFLAASHSDLRGRIFVRLTIEIIATVYAFILEGLFVYLYLKNLKDRAINVCI